MSNIIPNSNGVNMIGGNSSSVNLPNSLIWFVTSGLLVATLPFILSGLRILVFSEGNPILFNAIINNVDFSRLLLSTVYTLFLPTIYAACIVGFFARAKALTDSIGYPFYWFLTILIYVLAFLTIPSFSFITMLVAHLAIILLAWGAEGYNRTHVNQNGTHSDNAFVTIFKRNLELFPSNNSVSDSITVKLGVFLVGAAIIIVPLLQSEQVWMPKETIHVQEHKKHEIVEGYVLKEDSYITLLKEDLTIDIILVADIKHRDINTKKQISNPPLYFELLK